MRYIRTSNDKIYDLKTYTGWKVDEDGNYHIWHHPKYSCVYYIDIEAEDVIKTSDTLEELCDEFVFDGIEDKPLICDLYKNTGSAKNGYDEIVYWFNHSKEEQYVKRNCYGAIWTDKGLIYVAKMNEKGELELL